MTIRAPAPPLPPWLAAELSGFDRALVDVGGVRMHVMEAGRGQPVVLLHGNPTWGYLYRKVVAALDLARFRVIVPDLVGLGLSDKPKDLGVHTLDAHVRWMARLLEVLAPEPFILVGQDWGGPIGMGALEMAPALACGMVVLNTTIGPPRPGFRPTLFHRFSQARGLSDVAFRLFGFPQIALGFAQGDRRSIRGKTARAYRWPLRDVRTNGAVLAMARMVPDTLEHPSIPAMEAGRRFVEAFTGPTAIVWGHRDPVIGRAFKRVHRALPDAEVTHTQAGHFLQEEVPTEIAEAIVGVADRT